MTIATATWDWLNFGLLSGFVLAPLIILSLWIFTNKAELRYILVFSMLLLAVLSFLTYGTKDSSSPCPDIGQVGACLFFALGSFISSLVLLKTRFKWAILFILGWVIYISPSIISDLNKLWHEAQSFQ